MIGDEDSIKRPRDTDRGSFGFEQVSFDEKTGAFGVYLILYRVGMI